MSDWYDLTLRLKFPGDPLGVIDSLELARALSSVLPSGTIMSTTTLSKVSNRKEQG